MYRNLILIVWLFMIISAKDPCKEFMTMDKDISLMNDGIRHARHYASVSSPFKEGFLGFSLIDNTPKISVGFNEEVHLKDVEKENKEFIKAGTQVVIMLLDGEKIIVSTTENIYPKIKDHGLKKVWEIDLEMSKEVFEMLRTNPMKSAHLKTLNMAITINSFFKVGKYYKKLCNCFAQEEFWD